MGEMGKLDKKVALITGGNTGIGRAVALAFHREGASVAIGYVSEKKEAESLVRIVESDGGEALALRCDVTREVEVRRLVSRTEKQFRRIDILVNNAGILKVTPFLKLDKKTWDAHLAVHLTGAFLMSQAVLPGMVRRRRGYIINMSSQLAMVGRPEFVHYTAAKAGLMGFTRALAREFGPKGIHVNAIAPGLIDTGFDPMPESRKQAFARELPARRIGRPEDIAETAVFLASEDADFYMGQTLGPNGGEVMP